MVNEIPLASASPTFYGDRRCEFGVGGVVAGWASYTATFNRAKECLSCDVKHRVFPEERLGVGQPVRPPMIGDHGNCVPVFRMFDANFRDLRIRASLPC